MQHKNNSHYFGECGKHRTYSTGDGHRQKNTEYIHGQQWNYHATYHEIDYFTESVETLPKGSGSRQNGASEAEDES